MRTYVWLVLLASVAGCLADAIPLAVAEAGPGPEAKPHPIAWPFPDEPQGSEAPPDKGSEEEPPKEDDPGSAVVVKITAMLGPLGKLLEPLVKIVVNLLISLGIKL